MSAIFRTVRVAMAKPALAAPRMIQPAAMAAPRMIQPVQHVWQMAPMRSFASEKFLDAADVMERVMMVVSNFEKVDNAKVSKEAKFKEDLDLDSLDAVEIVMAIEEEFCIEIPDAESDKILSVADAVEYITSHPQAK
mmetsp:Transcript_17054/g.39961  ORF Transcript_17054/g.39961 Transcript_17054/m.39961 type:complete len:137 (+) Transcript_17054:82-492(+)|eukprot:CAMPEP_0119525816 /NCGR_PEP_ID=MMETSP1344-20130328/40532_1 /TAXON_ID=236787 /ORGANISM="Florenciella parvula, Strain CCMP2471" /LENGTH=136 /DNA_ID=CAMNT_0007564669 /DNA_START=55 /DNA_END=465 /DNA_ORIENTATION=-